MKTDQCCEKWKDISFGFRITFPEIDKDGYTHDILFDKRGILYCPQCGKRLVSKIGEMRRYFKRDDKPIIRHRPVEENPSNNEEK